jgi:hypothetical protein
VTADELAAPVPDAGGNRRAAVHPTVGTQPVLRLAISLKRRAVVASGATSCGPTPAPVVRGERDGKTYCATVDCDSIEAVRPNRARRVHRGKTPRAILLPVTSKKPRGACVIGAEQAMAVIMLGTMSFEPCRSCRRHVAVGDVACPFCGISREGLRRARQGSFARRLTARAVFCRRSSVCDHTCSQDTPPPHRRWE